MEKRNLPTSCTGECSVLQCVSSAFGAPPSSLAPSSLCPPIKALKTARGAPFHLHVPKLHKCTSCCFACHMPFSHALVTSVASAGFAPWAWCLSWAWPREPRLNLPSDYAELQKATITPFLPTFEVPLKSSPLFQCIHHSPSLGASAGLLTTRSVPSSRSSSDCHSLDIGFRGTPPVTSYKLNFVHLNKTLWDPQYSQFSTNLLAHLPDIFPVPLSTCSFYHI